MIAILAVCSFNALLYGSIFYGSFTVNWGVDYTLTLDNFIKLFGRGMSDGAWPSLLDTLPYAGIAAPITAAFGLPIAGLWCASSLKVKTIEFTYTCQLRGAGHRGGRLLYSRLLTARRCTSGNGGDCDYVDGDA